MEIIIIKPLVVGKFGLFWGMLKDALSEDLNYDVI